MLPPLEALSLPPLCANIYGRILPKFGTQLDHWIMMAGERWENHLRKHHLLRLNFTGTNLRKLLELLIKSIFFALTGFLSFWLRYTIKLQLLFILGTNVIGCLPLKLMLGTDSTICEI
ncbi:uncharacterized protein LOC109846479 [Asparagus officinalis]|uniref:uncharacterized protein LOC109846479 n=1 Tax=Asparagus officinalis TaxID=4686 RepID=UPI00098DE7DF|nr:uncharacterized protein LOC109846479 [Asparagus officinalis]